MELVEVADGCDRVEAEMIQGLLEGAGIPSLLEPTATDVDGSQRGFGRFYRGLGGGPQRVMVHAHRVAEARELLDGTFILDEDASS